MKPSSLRQEPEPSHAAVRSEAWPRAAQQEQKERLVPEQVKTQQEQLETELRKPASTESAVAELAPHRVRALVAGFCAVARSPWRREAEPAAPWATAEPCVPLRREALPGTGPAVSRLPTDGHRDWATAFRGLPLSPG